MSTSEQLSVDENKEFWEDANRYSWSNAESNFLKEISFIMTYLHRKDAEDQ